MGKTSLHDSLQAFPVCPACQSQGRNCPTCVDWDKPAQASILPFNAPPAEGLAVLSLRKKKSRKAKLAPLLGEGERIDWNTPRIIWDLAEKVGGGKVGLDPCSNPASIGRAVKTFSLEAGEDGLRESWGGYGLVYVNPPYGDLIVPWINRLAFTCGRLSRGATMGGFSVEAVALLPSRTDTIWFSTVWRSARALAFWKGRLTFLGAKDPAPFPSLLPYYGPNPYKFVDTFRDYAECVVLAA